MSLTRIKKTGEPQVISASDGRLTISVSIRTKRRGGRKLVTLPGRETGAIRPWDCEPTPLQLALAPEIVAAILDETLPPDLRLFDLAVDPPALWEEQRGADRLGKLEPIARIGDKSLGHIRVIVVPK